MQKFSQELPADGIEPTAKAILTRTLFYICNTASRIWTRDLKIRNLLFYPTELMRQNIRRETRTPTKPRFVAVCSIHLSYANLNAVWGIRTPMSFRATVFKTAAIPFCTKTAKIKFIKKTLKKLGWSDSDWRDAAVKVLCLTAWRQPNIFSGNALFRPVNSQICRFKRYPMLSRTLPNRHGVSRTPIFGFGDRHATINTTRLYIFNYFFQFFNQLTYLWFSIYHRATFFWR